MEDNRFAGQRVENGHESCDRCQNTHGGVVRVSVL